MKGLYYFDYDIQHCDGRTVLGPRKDLFNAENITGNCGGITGSAHNITGDVSTIVGDITGLSGDCTDVYLYMHDYTYFGDITGFPGRYFATIVEID
jgi:hypothetical protein